MVSYLFVADGDDDGGDESKCVTPFLVAAFALEKRESHAHNSTSSSSGLKQMRLRKGEGEPSHTVHLCNSPTAVSQLDIGQLDIVQLDIL